MLVKQLLPRRRDGPHHSSDRATGTEVVLVVALAALEARKTWMRWRQLWRFRLTSDRADLSG